VNGDDFSLSVIRVGDGTPHLGSGAQLRTNERRRSAALRRAPPYFDHCPQFPLLLLTSYHPCHLQSTQRDIVEIAEQRDPGLSAMLPQT